MAPVRLVDGEPSSEPFGSEVDYLAAPLTIGVGDAEAWRVEVVQEDDFLSPRFEPADVLVLAQPAEMLLFSIRKAARAANGSESGKVLTVFSPKGGTGKSVAACNLAVASAEDAKRTLLGKEVLPEHVAAAVFALTGGDLSQTTGLHVPVDSGVAAAFLR